MRKMAEQKYPQDEEQNEYRYISASWLDEIAKGLTKGAAKHPGETWRTIPSDEHLSRAMRHINLYRMGDRTEPHIINASMRLMMAFCTTLDDDVIHAHKSKHYHEELSKHYLREIEESHETDT
jgi:hypothetical protein|nr:MAG TPA: hypothetical protein [Caudoviricetes sp.]